MTKFTGLAARLLKWGQPEFFFFNFKHYKKICYQGKPRITQFAVTGFLLCTSITSTVSGISAVFYRTIEFEIETAQRGFPLKST